MNDSIVLVEIDQIERKKQSQCMDPPGRHDPYALIGPELQPSNQPSEARKDRIRSRDIQAEEAFARLVVYAVRPSFHSSPDLGDCSTAGRSHFQSHFENLMHPRNTFSDLADQERRKRPFRHGHERRLLSMFRKEHLRSDAPERTSSDHRNAW